MTEPHPVRLRIQFYSGDVLIHEFNRSTTNATREGIGAMIGSALGWMQAYQAAVSAEQWAMDVRRIEMANILEPNPKNIWVCGCGKTKAWGSGSVLCPYCHERGPD